MTIDDLSRTDDMAGVAMEPWVDLSGPDRLTGVVRGSVRIVDQGDRVLRFGPESSTTAKDGLVAVDPRTGHFSYTPSVPARQVSRTSTHYGDTVDTFTVDVIDVIDAYGTRAEAHVVVDIVPADIVLSGAALIGPVSADGVLTCRIDAAAWDGARLTFSLQNSSNPSDSTVESAFSEKGGLIRLDPSTGRFTFVPQSSDAAMPGSDVDRFVVTAIDPHGVTADITVVVMARLGIEVRTLDTAPSPPSAGVKTNTVLGGAKEAQWYPITIDSGSTLSIQSTSGGTGTLRAGPGGDHTLTFTSSGGSFFNKGPAGAVVLRVTDAFGCHTDRTYTY